MFQQTQSLYTREGSNLLMPHPVQDENEGYWSKKIYTQAEVNALLEKKNKSVYSKESEIESESHIADKQQRQENRIVANLVKKSNRILVSISSHAFPFDFIPDSVNVEEGRVTIIIRHFLSSEIHSIDIKDITNVFINTNFIFSQLVIISRTFEDNEIRVRNLRTKDAVFIRRIIEGMRILDDQNINTADYSKEQLITKLEELSKTKIVT
jgi:hypothetical protein